jgi:Fe2+ or Zn2+ uptake regulation protein
MVNNATYYNTNGLSGNALRGAVKKTGNQDQAVLQVMQDAGRPLSPSEIHKLAFTPATPITSVRRSLSNLTKRGDLIKLETTKLSPYNVPEHLWEIVGV